MLLQKHLRPIRPCRVPQRGAAVRVCCAALKLGPYDFPNKDSARDQIRQILRETYQESMIMPDSEYGQLLMDLVQQHPRAAEKIGCGVSYFTTARRWLDNVPTKHFVLCRTDGTSDDFSYLKCLKLAYVPKPGYAAAATAAPDSSSVTSSNSIAAANAASIAAYSGRSGSSSPSRRSSSSSCSGSSSPVDQSWSSLQSVEDSNTAPAFERFPTATGTATVTYPIATYRTALRNAVTSHTASFKAQAFDASALTPMFCPLAGVLLTLDNSRAVETAATPFLDLVDGWLQQQGCELEQVQVEFQQPRNSFSRGANGKPIMADFQQKFSWQEFYREHVQLQLVSHAGFGNRQNAKNAEKYGSSSGGGFRDSSFSWAAANGSSSEVGQQQQQQQQLQEAAADAGAPGRVRRVIRRSSSSSAPATSGSEGGGIASIGSEGASSSVQADDSSSWYSSSGSRGADGSSSSTVRGTRSRGSRTRSSKSSNSVSNAPADSSAAGAAAGAAPSASAGGVDVAGLLSEAFAAGFSTDSSTSHHSSSSGGSSSSSSSADSPQASSSSKGEALDPPSSSSSSSSSSNNSSEDATAASAPVAGRRRRRLV